jgi:hypothetical protein
LLDDEKGSGSVTNGSGCGSGRPKNIPVRILRIRIHNTDSYNSQTNAQKSAVLNKIYPRIDEVDVI